MTTLHQLIYLLVIPIKIQIKFIVKYTQQDKETRVAKKKFDKEE